MKNKWWLVVLGLALLMVLLLFLRSPEDSWIKDERGCWIKHGMPSQTPDYVLEQQNLTNCSEKIIAPVHPDG